MILFDTDILINVLRNDLGTLAWFERRLEQEPQVGLSVISKLELLKGCRTKKERYCIGDWLKEFEIIPIEHSISVQAEGLFETYYPKQGMGILDAFIAATALERKMILCSANKKHFQKIPHLRLETPNGDQ
jgi:predicted nucleic acid-binding protein